MNPEKAVASTLIGEGLILEGPEIVESAAGGWGAGQELMNTPFGHGVENMVDASQGIGAGLGVFALTFIGMKMMLDQLGGDGKKKGRSAY